MTEHLNALFYPDGKSLHKMVVGQSGSGKSYFIEASAKAFWRQKKDPNMRMVYFSPKNEGFTDLLDKKQKPVSSVEDMNKQLVDHKIVVFYPDITGLEDTMDDVINALFNIKEQNPDFKCTLIIDDCQVFLSSRKAASDAFNRIALLGRSRNLNCIYCSHGVVLNKSLEGQVDIMAFFTLPAKLHFKQTEERFGFDPTPHMDSLNGREYSFLYVDIRKGSVNMMNPIGE
jgi:ABC-type dipeptide/oligopeptide/nickel transport system ATPase component